MKSLNVLVVGSGGREHALAWKLAQSPSAGKLFVAPGNTGTAALGENVPIAATAIAELADFAQTNSVALTVVGPDEPLALGIVDAFRARGLKIFGPTKAAAQIEWSKAFAKELMTEAGIPTAPAAVFSHYGSAFVHLETRSYPVVVKASGLARGKGTFVCRNFAEAEAALRRIVALRTINGESQITVEDYLGGRELSIHALCDGKATILFPLAQDHKRLRDGDEGPMTGGMGAIAPVPGFTAGFEMRLRESVVNKALDHLVMRKTPFTGLLYPGVIVTEDGPKVLEYNARFGDPETQVFLQLLKTDLLDLLNACVNVRLADLFVQWHGGFAVSVALVSAEYGETDALPTDFPIVGVEEAESLPGVVVFHGGTKQRGDGTLVTAGGRVLHVTAIGDTLPAALERVYAACDRIRFEGRYFRRDIGKGALDRSRETTPKT